MSRNRRKRSASLNFEFDKDSMSNVDAGIDISKQGMSKKSRRKAMKKAKITEQSFNDIDNAVISQNTEINSACGNVSLSYDLTDQDITAVNASQSQTQCVENCTEDCSCSCSRIVQSLRLEVDRLNGTVRFLVQQVNLLSAAMGQPLRQDLQKNLQTEKQPVNTESIVVDTESIQHQSSSAVANQSFASVVASTPAVNQIKCNLVSAVYKDMAEKKKRANNIVITGLSSQDGFDDKSVVSGMILQQFGRQVAVRSSRRLGKPIAGRAQKLLVTLSSTEDAAYIVTNAGILRRSPNEFVRTNVFINADLTQAEAKAAFELRCIRRERAMVSRGRSQHLQGPGSRPVVYNSSQPGTAAPYPTITVSSTGPTSQLNANAMNFVPSSPEQPLITDDGTSDPSVATQSYDNDASRRPTI